MMKSEERKKDSHSKSSTAAMRTGSPSPVEVTTMNHRRTANNHTTGTTGRADSTAITIVIDSDDDDHHHKKSSLDQTQKVIVDLTSSVATSYTQSGQPSGGGQFISQSTQPSNNFANKIITLDEPSSSSFQKHPKKRKRDNMTMSMSTFHCAICLEDGVEEWMGHSLIQCRHQFCLPCLANHIQLSPTTKVKCPCCPLKMELFDVQRILISVGNEKEWQSFSEKASSELLEREIAVGDQGEGTGETRRCPAERCNYTFMYEPRNPEFQEGTKFDCPQCKASFCLQCGANNGKVGPPHEGNCYERREQLQKEKAERRKFEEWKRKNSQADARFYQLLQKESGRTKACPNCKSAITKNGGCDHMHCTNCNLDFNWSQAKSIHEKRT